jgi:hypothetical protein
MCCHDMLCFIPMVLCNIFCTLKQCCCSVIHTIAVFEETRAQCNYCRCKCKYDDVTEFLESKMASADRDGGTHNEHPVLV